MIVGGDGDLHDSIRRRYAGLSGVHFTGWLEPAQISAVLALGVVGVVPWTTGDAFPNKAFTYLAAGLPILTSASGDLRHIIQQEGIGSYFEPGAVAELADLLARFTGDREGLKGMSVRVRNVYAKRFDATTIYREYADYLGAMAER